MCEFNVFLDGKKVFEDVVYAEEHSGSVLLKNILGETMEKNGCRIMKVDVLKVMLILSNIR